MTRPRIVRSLAVLRCLQCPQGFGMVVWGWSLYPREPYLGKSRLWLEFKLSSPLVKWPWSSWKGLIIPLLWHWLLGLCEVPACLCWAEQHLGLLLALEAWPEGLDRCSCQVTAHQLLLLPSPRAPLFPAPYAPVGMGSRLDLSLQLGAAAVGGHWVCHYPEDGTFFGGFQVLDQTQIPASLLCYVLDRGLCYEEQCFI